MVHLVRMRDSVTVGPHSDLECRWTSLPKNRLVARHLGSKVVRIRYCPTLKNP